jgi:hypothetical protein
MAKRSNGTGCGCAGCLVMAAGVGVIGLALLAVGYIELVYTALPIRAGATLFEWMAKDRGLRVEGISGSLSSDIRVASVRWDSGEIIDLQIQHDGFREMVRKRKLVVREAQARMMQLDLCRPVATGVVARVAHSNGVSCTGGSLASLAEGCTGFLELNRVALAGAVLTNRATGFSARLPACAANTSANLLRELLARAFYGQEYDSLAPAEQADINRQIAHPE